MRVLVPVVYDTHMKKKPSQRRNYWIPDEMHKAVEVAAQKETMKTGKWVTVAAWVRGAISARLAKSK